MVIRAKNEARFIGETLAAARAAADAVMTDFEELDAAASLAEATKGPLRLGPSGGPRHSAFWRLDFSFDGCVFPRMPG